MIEGMVDGDKLSSIFGWISIGCWILVYSPQVYENYRLQSGEGLSVLFLLAWVTGDLCNLLGAVLGGLVPTVIFLAIYYLSCDLLLVSQIYYYRWKRSRWPIRLGPMYDLPTPNTSTTALASESTLDSDDDYDEELEPLLGSMTRSKILMRGEGSIAEEDGTLGQLVAKYTLCLVFVSMLGVGAWWVDEGRFLTGNGGGGPLWGGDGTWGGEEWLRKWVVQILGWTSAAFYLTGHFPQIFKNFETRCEGLSPALFIFSIFGCLTYMASICAKSMDKDYLITNASWLVAQGLTAVLDIIIIAQIVFYRFTERGRAGGRYALLR